MSHHRKQRKFQLSKVCTEWHLYMVYRPYQKKASAPSECSGLLHRTLAILLDRCKMNYYIFASQNHQSLHAFKNKSQSRIWKRVHSTLHHFQSNRHRVHILPNQKRFSCAIVNPGCKLVVSLASILRNPDHICRDSSHKLLS